MPKQPRKSSLRLSVPPPGMLGFAEGGIIKETPAQLMARIDAKYGTGKAADPAPVQQPAPQPQAQQAPQNQGIGSGVINILKGRKEQIDKASGYADGGIIRGQGTSTSDSIPASVRETGEPIKVSTGERIVSADQGRFLEVVAKNAGYKSLDDMLEDGTGKPVGPTIKWGKRAAEDGKPPELDPFAYRGLKVEDPKRVAVAIAAPPTLGGAPLSRTEPAGGALSGPASGISDFTRSSPLPIPQFKQDPFGPDTRSNSLPLLNVAAPSATGAAYTSPVINKPGRNGDGIITAEDVATDLGPGSSRTNLGTMNLAEQNERMAKALGYGGTDDFNKQWRLRSDPEEQQADRAANGSPDAALRAATIRRGQDMRAETAADRIDSNEYIAGERIVERAGRTDKPKAPTLAQERSNAEIDAARERIAGMTPEEIKKKTANFTATGRENPDYDPTLAKAVAQANRRKVGDDSHFDERQQRTAGNGYDRSEVAARFRAEHDMADYKLGNDTQNGVEVLDASGKIIGHYR